MKIDYKKYPKLEIASGSKPKEGYLHFDIRSLPGVDIVGDAKELPFINNSFEEIYTRFFLEHLYRKDAKIVLGEMFRVLKNEGKLEIIVPNIFYFFKLFLEESGQKKEWALNKVYGFENYKEDHHYFGYDEEILKQYLEASGFTNIQRIEDEEQYLHLTALKKK